MVPEKEFTVAALAERFMRVHVDVHCKPRTVATCRSVLERHNLHDRSNCCRLERHLPGGNLTH